MSIQSRHEERLLSAGERELVDASHQPFLGTLSHDALRELARRLREERDRAAAIARRQKREMRGKADPRGARPARDNLGTLGKSQVLAQALKRVNRELGRLDEAEAQPTPTLVEIAHRALAMKRAARQSYHPGAGRTAARGMRSKPSQADTVQMDPREIGRVSQATRVAQARKDG